MSVRISWQRIVDGHGKRLPGDYHLQAESELSILSLDVLLAGIRLHHSTKCHMRVMRTIRMWSKKEKGLGHFAHVALFA